MWILFARSPSPDAPYWPGRRWLAAADAVAWPAVWVLLLRALPEPSGIVLPLMCAVAAMVAVRRLRRAVWANHRYQFTTWHWCRTVGNLLLVGCLLKLLLVA